MYTAEYRCVAGRYSAARRQFSALKLTFIKASRPGKTTRQAGAGPIAQAIAPGAAIGHTLSKQDDQVQRLQKAKRMAPTQPRTNKLVSVEFRDGFDIDSVLNNVAAALAADGVRVAGLVQQGGATPGGAPDRTLALRDLATGDHHRITEERGAAALGCRLDWQAITELAQRIETGLDDAPDVLIVNRFGRAESEGRGFRGAIEKALAQGACVIVAVRDEYKVPWQAFHAGLAVSAAPEAADILAHVSGVK